MMRVCHEGEFDWGTSPWMLVALSLVIGLGCPDTVAADSITRPNIVLVMADDQGWGETGYNGHPRLKTPHLDALASDGLRFNRFYAGAPVCSPTRATVLTGRNNDRTGTDSHGYPLRRQEITIAQLLGSAGYVTGHFGKWHLDGLRGPGVPILENDTHHPGRFGFEHWLSVTNFFDRDPLLSRMGKFEAFLGDSSEVVVEESLKFLRHQAAASAPSFAVVWFGTPHSPFRAIPSDMESFEDLDEKSRHHYGELVAMDRSIGTLRAGLQDIGIAQQTLIWFCSDNGGLPRITPTTVGGLRGFKNTIYEGGLRVPAIMHWPARFQSSRQIDTPASVADILPTLLAITGLSDLAPEVPLDGVDLLPLIESETEQPRPEPIFFRHANRAAMIDNQWKLLTTDQRAGKFELYHLSDDPAEQHDLADSKPETYQRMRLDFERWNRSIERSRHGKDYPEGKVNEGEPAPRFWHQVDDYQPYLEQWSTRPEYESWMQRRRK